MFVARFQNKNGLIYQTISDEFAETLKDNKPNGKPVEHAYGGCLIVWMVPDIWAKEAIWRAKMGHLRNHCVWEYHGVGITATFEKRFCDCGEELVDLICRHCEKEAWRS